MFTQQKLRSLLPTTNLMRLIESGEGEISAYTSYRTDNEATATATACKIVVVRILLLATEEKCF